MKPTRFVSTEFGRAVRTPGQHGYLAFIPGPLPRTVRLEEGTILTLSEADRALGRLAGVGRLLPNPYLLVGPYRTREAVASSRIEGTHASLPEVFDAAAGGPMRGDVREVLNYIRALEHGLTRLETLPLSLRLIREMHAVLMRDVRGRERTPGEFRRTQNWIGSSPRDTIETAIFVPPEPGVLTSCLDDFERALHDSLPMPPLIQCGLLHYQFETIHPFLDGNGRIGRLLIVLFLVHKELLPQPLLYVSSFFERHRSEYYDLLQAVRERGELQAWLRFFLTAVATEAVDAIERADRLIDLRERYRGLLAGRTRSRAAEVVDLLVEGPVLTAPAVAGRLQMSQQGAMNLIRQLHDVGILSPIEGARRPVRWIATEIIEALQVEG